MGTSPDNCRKPVGGHAVGAVGMGKWGKPTQTLNSKTAHDF